MTHEQDEFLIISRQSNQECSYCGEQEEVRPYGENGRLICFHCMKKEAGVEEKAIERYRERTKGKKTLHPGGRVLNDETQDTSS